MKSIQSYDATKYQSPSYKKIEDGVYNYKGEYVTTLSFQQEPEFGEGEDAAYISQYPLEDILDKYLVYVSDYYETLNKKESETCYMEFAGEELEAIKKLRSIIGQHVYNRRIQKNGKEYVELAIEPEKKESV